MALNLGIRETRYEPDAAERQAFERQQWIRLPAFLDAALLKLDRKRRKDKPPTERVRLNVPYEQKDAAKRLGARWDPAERVWWLSVEHETAINKAKALGFLSEP